MFDMFNVLSIFLYVFFSLYFDHIDIYRSEYFAGTDIHYSIDKTKQKKKLSENRGKPKKYCTTQK